MLALLAGVSAQTSTLPAPADSRLPGGPGKAALLKACSPCHGADSAVAQFKTTDEWKKTLDEMAANGADATDEEWKEILGYVDKHFSLILVNTADARRLANTLDVPDAQGDAIVRYRDEHGRIAAVDDLKKVPGLDVAKIDARKDRLIF
jgi:competence protein ComEA